MKPPDDYGLKLTLDSIYLICEIYICETSIQSKHEKIKFKSNTADGGYFLSKCGKSKSE